MQILGEKLKMKYLIIATLITILGCGKTEDVKPNPVVPVVPVTPIDPDATTHATGFIKKSSGHGLGENPVFKRPTMYAGDLPVSFDWRNLGFTVPVRNQKACGSCWAFATIAALDFSMMIFDWHTDLASEQELVDCAPFYGCNGGDWAGKYAKSKGVASDADYPYVARDQSCKNKTKLAQPYDEFSLGSKTSAPTVDEVKAAILQFGAVASSVYAHSTWDNYHDGPMEGCRNSAQANHLVALIGWDKDGNWVMRNSWGESWGDKGYALMPFGCDGIADDAAYFQLHKPVAEINTATVITRQK